MNWINLLTLLILTSSISGTLVYLVWKIVSLLFSRFKLYKICFYSFKILLFFWIFPLQFFIMYALYGRRGSILKAVNTESWTQISRIFMVVWVIGLFLYTLYFAFAFYQLKILPKSRKQSIVSDAVHIVNSAQKNWFFNDENGNEQLYPGINLNEPVHVYCSTVPVPMTSIGIVPKIYIPSLDYTKEELSIVVYHELNHILNGDLKTRGWLILIKILFWFHPLAHVLLYEFERWSEIICDIDVCNGRYSYISKNNYIKLLLKNAQCSNVFMGSRIFAKHYFMSGLSLEGKRLKERIEKLYHYKPYTYSSFICTFICILIFLLCLGLIVQCGLCIVDNIGEYMMRL